MTNTSYLRNYAVVIRLCIVLKCRISCSNFFAYNGKETASRFNLTYMYIDNVLSINITDFENYLRQIYHVELESRTPQRA